MTFNLMDVAYGMFGVMMILVLFVIILAFIRIIAWMISNWNKKWTD